MESPRQHHSHRITLSRRNKGLRRKQYQGLPKVGHRNKGLRREQYQRLPEVGERQSPANQTPGRSKARQGVGIEGAASCKILSLFPPFLYFFFFTSSSLFLLLLPPKSKKQRALERRAQSGVEVDSE
ncbi:hypothetical protein H6P81_012300 [Aristolochia fimbriata]|uniref:Uncharacterized protein n=1 Tax=Aristolochia fimbriata TaxID=158543 RepID=A0AAV7EF39_ARIFI|nr:hypothetical protein H6P81_012300 [Aristolochia fimbriata]